ncbi:MAG: glycosyltransferase family 2 protein [Deltaproteobacteria bacterium]|nr:glycosyltransferase family 2 protein [Deltaproteobacteria bacterium]
MFNDKTVAVVIPAYNEEDQILQVLEGIPAFVDRIVVVDDCSKDKTAEIVSNFISRENQSRPGIAITRKKIEQTRYNRADMVLNDMALKESEYFTPATILNSQPDRDRFIFIKHLENGGVGAAIASGYKWCLDHQIDCTAVMAGDGQMDPAELESICRPVIDEGVDYVKGNRLIHRSAWLVIPKTRYLGNSILSILTKIASGYWHVSDTQSGYTAISLQALRSIKIYKIYKKYGMPNDLLVKLNIAFCTIKEVGIKPVYDIGEKSKMKLFKVIPRISWLLLKSFFIRLWAKYLIRDFHPLFLLYHFSFLLWFISIPYMLKILSIMLFTNDNVSPLTMLAFAFLFISAFQSLLFAMWMDIQDNERLYK